MPPKMLANFLIFKNMRKITWGYGGPATSRKRRMGTTGGYMGYFLGRGETLGYPFSPILQLVLVLFASTIPFC